MFLSNFPCLALRLLQLRLIVSEEGSPLILWHFMKRFVNYLKCVYVINASFQILFNIHMVSGVEMRMVTRELQHFYNAFISCEEIEKSQFLPYCVKSRLLFCAVKSKLMCMEWDRFLTYPRRSPWGTAPLPRHTPVKTLPSRNFVCGR